MAAAVAVDVDLLSWKIEILKLTVSIIGVCGMGRVGKNTLVKNLNNELIKTIASGSKLSFGLVVWVTVPKPPIDIDKVQTKIANRIDVKVDVNKRVQDVANKIHQRLKQEMSSVLILDHAWQMKTYTETKVYTMNEDESWQLFVKKAEDNASLEHIQPFAKAIARECNGLPLAIVVIGASVREEEGRVVERFFRITWNVQTS
ncbi:hypothetical protein H5410_035725 [Solanum commersonii]|uniref:NB-ARC domain-containing protein n=1 Tax=Solanum commersonii TaxID=4109 RepID=A0A9J5Y2P3_SOLCO|nr:hypothetical protein H5410_035725 [Solanum commersonii]